MAACNSSANIVSVSGNVQALSNTIAVAIMSQSQQGTAAPLLEDQQVLGVG